VASLIDTSLWIDFTRTRSPKLLKEFLAPYILDPEAHVAEPISFEILRHASKEEVRQLSQYLDTYPSLETPSTIWTEATKLGQACRQIGFTPGSLDLLIAVVALHHHAELVTLDSNFQRMAKVSSLRVNLLRSPAQ
jgi:predicted nucleic acid-binding protein